MLSEPLREITVGIAIVPSVDRDQPEARVCREQLRSDRPGAVCRLRFVGSNAEQSQTSVIIVAEDWPVTIGIKHDLIARLSVRGDETYQARVVVHLHLRRIIRPNRPT